ncbi:MAG: response regulator transcription factor [Sporichthyaceae bacterium]
MDGTNSRTLPGVPPARSAAPAAMPRPLQAPGRTPDEGVVVGLRQPENRPVNTVRVVLAENLALYGGALVALLSYERDIQVVASLRTDADVVGAVQRTRADVAIVDVDAIGRDGYAVSRELHSVAPRCKVLVLTSGVTPGALRRALEAHAQGLIDKDAPASWLAESIRRVANGERVVDPKLAIAALESDGHTLTERELEVLRRAAEGESVREIASKLCLSDGTVRNYLSKIIGKLGARNRIDAIRIVRDSGWL